MKPIDLQLLLVTLIDAIPRGTSRPGVELAVLLVDLVGFERINDTPGRAADDELPRRLGQRRLGQRRHEPAADVGFAARLDGGVRRFDTSSATRFGRRAHRERGLSRALDDGALELHHQPQWRVDAGAVTSVEAPGCDVMQGFVHSGPVPATALPGAIARIETGTRGATLARAA